MLLARGRVSKRLILSEICLVCCSLDRLQAWWLVDLRGTVWWRRVWLVLYLSWRRIEPWLSRWSGSNGFATRPIVEAYSLAAKATMHTIAFCGARYTFLEGTLGILNVKASPRVRISRNNRKRKGARQLLNGMNLRGRLDRMRWCYLCVISYKLLLDYCYERRAFFGVNL